MGESSDQPRQKLVRGAEAPWTHAGEEPQRCAHLAPERLLAAAHAATVALGSVMRPKLKGQPETGFGGELTQMLAAIEAVTAEGRAAPRGQ